MAKRTHGGALRAQSIEPSFDVALSFAGEDRAYVERTAHVLRRMGLRVFYDKYEQVSLWGKNLYDHLSQIYGNTSRYTVMFISKHYARKLWTNLERQSAQAKAFAERREYILPVRFDNTDIPGIHATIGYIGLNTVSPRQLAELIKEKIGPLVRENFMPEDPDRLLTVLGAKTEARKRRLRSIAEGVFRDLSLMTPEERRLISIIYMNTCPAGPAIDQDVHIDISLLSRMVGLSRREIVALCSRLECLSFSYKLTSHNGKSSRKDILRLIYEPLYAAEELSGNWTTVVHGIFACISENLCPSCCSIAIDRMDFSVLSTLAGFPEQHSPAQTSKEDPVVRTRTGSSSETRRVLGRQNARTKLNKRGRCPTKHST